MGKARRVGWVWQVGLAGLLACSSSATPPAPTARPGSSATGAPAATAATPAAPTASGVSSAPAPTPRPRETVAVALPTIAQAQLPYYIAREKGFFEEEGIEAELSIVAPNLGVQGLLGGAYTFTGAGAQAAIGSLTGAPLRVIFNQNPTVTWWLMAHPRANVRTIPDLRGKTIGIEGPGSLSFTYTRAVLRKNGLNPDDDVQFANLGPVANWLPPVFEHVVDAGIAPDADPYLVAKQRGLTEVFWYGAELNAPLSGLGTTETLLTSRPDLVKRFLRGAIKGLRYYKADKDFTVALAARLLSQDPEIARQSYDLNRPLMLDDPILDEAAQREFLELAKDVLSLQRAVAPSEVYQYDLTRQAIQELSAERWSPRP